MLRFVLKSLFILSFTIGFAQISQGQTYGNEWIDYSKTYYKIKVGNSRIHRINQSVLAAAGIPGSVTADKFRLYKNGQEVPLYLSTNGVLSATDYIEFMGFAARGELDKELYVDTSWHMSNYTNFISDTATYFLTYDLNATTSGLRFTNALNTITTPTPPKEVYCWDTILTVFKNYYSPGEDYDFNPNYEFNSSRFEEAEGFCRKYLYNSSDSFTIFLPSAYKVAGGPNAKAQSKITGLSSSALHNVKIEINDLLVNDSAFAKYDSKYFNSVFSPTTLPANNGLKFKYTAYNAGGNDAIGLSSVVMEYPRTFVWNNSVSEIFMIEPRATSYYFEITVANVTGGAPTLYDLTNLKVYNAVVAGTTLKFQLPPQATNTWFILVNQQATSKVNVASLESVNFAPIQQGNYLMFYPKDLIGISTGTELSDYKTYRESAAGGGHHVTLIELEKIYDQFGWGSTYHPAGIQRFLKYAKANWNTYKPENILLIGKGVVYRSIKNFQTDLTNNPSVLAFKSITPTFGSPGSDILLADITKDNIPDFNIGRISCYTAGELGIYLEKVKQYEARAALPNMQTVDSSLWKKRILHIAGGKSVPEQSIILNGLTVQKNVIEDTLYGGSTKLVIKNVANPIQPIENAIIDSLINEGFGLIQFYGHSSSYTFEYGLRPPDYYNNKWGRYPLFIANGCFAGDLFSYVTGLVSRTLTDLWIFEPKAGAIGFVASVNIGYPGFLDKYTTELYSKIGRVGQPYSIGDRMTQTIKSLMTAPVVLDYTRLHTEQIQLNGDPVINIVHFAKPDYAIEEKFLSITPAVPTTNIDSIKIDLTAFNLGMHIRDSVDLILKRTYPNGSSEIVYSKTYSKGLGFSDTLSFSIPVNPILGKGLNTFEFFIEAKNKIDELSESNNRIIRTINILDDEVIASYPNDYSIVYQQGVSLIGYTLNPFAPLRKYIMQIDTTKNFNSGALLTTMVESKGGLVEWKPLITLQDSVVYYWRVSKDTSNGSLVNWSGHSFIYLKNGSDGWNHSHYYQFLDDKLKDIDLNTNQVFDFKPTFSEYKFVNTTQGNPAPYNYNYTDFNVQDNGSIDHTGACAYNVIQITVIDTLTGKLIRNEPQASNPSKGIWGSNYCARETDNFFDFNIQTTADRQALLSFLDSIPPQHTVVMANYFVTTGSLANKVFTQQLLADSVQLGVGNTLYDKLKALGFAQVDSLNRNRPWIFTYNKLKGPNNSVAVIGIDSTAKIEYYLKVPLKIADGYLSSTVIGAASEWTSFHQNTLSIGSNLGDSTYTEIYGLDSNKLATKLATVWAKDTTLAWIDAKQYPYLQLRWYAYDSILRTCPQNDYLRVMYKPLTDLAIAPNLTWNLNNNLIEGQILNLDLAVKNISNVVSDSTSVVVTILDKSAQVLAQKELPLNKMNPLEQRIINTNFDTRGKTSAFSISAEVNKKKNPSEVTYVNNNAQNNITVASDIINPILDVTFDGIHIFNNDIVSAQPYIRMKLKDENTYLRLDDTSIFRIYLTYPNGTRREMFFINDTLRFIPANNTGENAAYAELRPNLLTDGTYELEVTAKDMKGNSSGNQNYRIAFRVINKPSISNAINYPNPFNSSTQFLFTLTGRTVPPNLKIQILNISGKVVREITRQELGNVHIGRNITDYRWDGRDQFGQKLGNGVYFYRLIGNFDGEEIDQFYIKEVDKFVHKGMGKLVIMR